MVPLDRQSLTKFDAARQQLEAAIELFYAKRYAPSLSLAAAAEGCIAAPASTPAGPDADIAGPEPLFEAMKRGAKEQYDMDAKDAVGRFNALRDWLKHET